MARLGFGAFLAPHHPIGENPMLQFRRDIALREAPRRARLRRVLVRRASFLGLGDDRLARDVPGRGRRAHQAHQARDRRDLAALPQPFNVAQRMVQLDHMTGGRAIFGSGPGALPSDAYALGIDPMTQRDRQDEAIDIIRRLFRGERVTQKGEWYDLHDAGLQLLPLQEEMPFAVASQISPSGMTLAGKYGIGIISLGSMSSEGLTALPTQWGFAETRRQEARHDGRPQELARAAQLAHRRDPREGARGGQARPDALAQRIHPRHAAAAGLGRLQVARRRRSTRWAARARPPSSARRTTS